MTLKRLEKLYGVVMVQDAIAMMGDGWTSDNSITYIMEEFQIDKETAEDLHAIIDAIEHIIQEA